MSGPPTVTDAEFALFQRLIHEEAGILLAPHKKALLANRLARRLRELGLRTLSAYYRRIKTDGEAERQRLLDAITTNETQFFREPHQLAFLERRVVPEWRARATSGRQTRRVRVWSAACSTGEEPYTLAMILRRFLPPARGWRVEILGSDLSTWALARATQATWPIERAGEIPADYRRAFMLRGTGDREGELRIVPQVRRTVRFSRINLNAERYPVQGRFDLILCRNCLMYFSYDRRCHVVRRLLSHLRPGGYLFVGHAENLDGVTDRVRRVVPTVYRIPDGAVSADSGRAQA
ncbi:MAG: CheR family methyltransferase [Gemmatimonadota bacterium]